MVEPDVTDATPPAVAARYWLTVASLGVFSTDQDCFEAAARGPLPRARRAGVKGFFGDFSLGIGRGLSIR